MCCPIKPNMPNLIFSSLYSLSLRWVSQCWLLSCQMPFAEPIPSRMSHMWESRLHVDVVSWPSWRRPTPSPIDICECRLCQVVQTFKNGRLASRLSLSPSLSLPLSLRRKVEVHCRKNIFFLTPYLTLISEAKCDTNTDFKRFFENSRIKWKLEGPKLCVHWRLWSKWYICDKYH